jgi:hypothetical protein
MMNIRITVICDVMPCSLVDIYTSVLEEHAASIFRIREDGDSSFLTFVPLCQSTLYCLRYIYIYIYIYSVRRRWVDNIRMDLGEVGWGDVDWIGLAQDRNR